MKTLSGIRILKLRTYANHFSGYIWNDDGEKEKLYWNIHGYCLKHYELSLETIKQLG